MQKFHTNQNTNGKKVFSIDQATPFTIQLTISIKYFKGAIIHHNHAWKEADVSEKLCSVSTVRGIETTVR